VAIAAEVFISNEGYMSLSNTTAWEENLRALTTQAGQAAELGRWDQVEECYRLRDEHLRDHSMLPALATGLIQFDLEVAARIENARLAVQSQLSEAAKIRQKLQGIRSWQGLSETERPRMDQVA
jgi:O-acetyl-ADP-ribose deacetylase (regulator of RNase III)